LYCKTVLEITRISFRGCNPVILFFAGCRFQSKICLHTFEMLTKAGLTTFMSTLGVINALVCTQRTIFVADSGNNCIREISEDAGYVSTIAGTSTAGFQDGYSPLFDAPQGVAVSPDGSLLYIADMGNSRIRKLNIQSGFVTTLAGNGIGAFSGGIGYRDGKGTSALFSYPSHVAITPDGSILYAADNGKMVRSIITSSGQTSTITGSAGTGFQDGAAATAKFGQIMAVCVSPDGKTVFVADWGNGAVRAVNLQTRVVSTLARFGSPFGLSVSLDGAILYVSDQLSNCIRKVNTASSIVSTLSGSCGSMIGSKDGAYYAARFYSPSGISLSIDGLTLFVADYGNSAIRAIDAATGATSTFAGGSTGGLVDEPLLSAGFRLPNGVAVSPCQTPGGFLAPDVPVLVWPAGHLRYSGALGAPRHPQGSDS
jgi:DNA-binding beta-propeller fold protein YncE